VCCSAVRRGAVWCRVLQCVARVCCSVLQCVATRSSVVQTTGCRRPIGCLISAGHFLQNSPIICGSFAKNDPELKASYGSSPPCNAPRVSQSMSELQGVVVCCSALYCGSGMLTDASYGPLLRKVCVCCSMLQCVAVRCSALQFVAVRC